MKVAGFQSLSLLDYPARPCAIIFTQGCLFRCSYCHNPDLIPIDAEKSVAQTTLDDYMPRLKLRQEMVGAICITGGEPTIHPDLYDDMKRLRAEGFLIKLDTNGINPDRLASIIDAGLVDYIAMDVKGVWDRYSEVIQIKSRDIIMRCQKSFALIQSSGVEHEFRTTIHPTAHVRDDFFVVASYLKPGERYFIQETRFEKTLDPQISHTISFEVAPLVRDLKEAFPLLLINER